MKDLFLGLTLHYQAVDTFLVDDGFPSRKPWSYRYLKVVRVMSISPPHSALHTPQW